MRAVQRVLLRLVPFKALPCYTVDDDDNEEIEVRTRPHWFFELFMNNAVTYAVDALMNDGELGCLLLADPVCLTKKAAEVVVGNPNTLNDIRSDLEVVLTKIEQLHWYGVDSKGNKANALEKTSS